MSSPEQQLRLVQSGEILFVIACFFVKRLGSLETREAISPGQWLIIAAAIWSGISGFTVQRRINRAETRPQGPSSRSTPLRRWRTGNPCPPFYCDSSRLVGSCSALLRWSGVACQCSPWIRNAAFADMEAGNCSNPIAAVTPIVICYSFRSFRNLRGSQGFG